MSDLASNKPQFRMSSEDTELRLYHGTTIGRIEVSTKTKGMTLMMAKGDAVALRDALNYWINK